MCVCVCVSVLGGGDVGVVHLYQESDSSFSKFSDGIHLNHVPLSPDPSHASLAQQPMAMVGVSAVSSSNTSSSGTGEALLPKISLHITPPLLGMS